MSKKRCCGNAPVAAVVSPCGGLCTNPICAIILLIILQRTCLLENKNAFLLILLFLGFCFCSGRRNVVNGY
ncbi:hypothetical protein LGK95_05305 [Clostridium algoriphilum]|uniref:hypothetical protein n=1 Tax=Clostridium algoriphilum TaxID=198347 RepID=UPI001CF49BD7|nr:hypothetical protein [Clostridium algoriphilum]MCB2292938.1 hypothetical protein [Clostridium algoriphilum]